MTARSRILTRALAATVAAAAVLPGCRAPAGRTEQTAGPAAGGTPAMAPGRPLTLREAAFLDTLQERTFRFFWELSDPRTGLTPDRAPTKSFSSVAAEGFALTAYGIGVERRYVTRAQAAERARNTLRFFWTARQGDAPSGCIGYRGFFYHFLDPATGHRFADVELSTVDTALLLAGALFCQSYFDGPDTVEAAIRALADSLYLRVEWTWAVVRPPMIAHGWDPREGFLPYDWRGMNESLILPILAMASPTHPVPPAVYADWLRGCRWGSFHGYGHVGFAPLFGHQYSQVWLDLRGVRDSLMQAHDSDWFENSRRATYAQRAYAIANPGGFRGYGADVWGLTACDGPFDGRLTIAGREREFRTYAARGASFTEVVDDGTIAPAAAGGSLPFAPEIVIPALIAMRETYGENLFRRYGFVDAFNPTLTVAGHTQHGRTVPGVGWFDDDYLGIDQGPILCMAENHRSGLVWRVMRRNPHVIRGLRAAGFRGGWLDLAPRDR